MAINIDALREALRRVPYLGRDVKNSATNTASAIEDLSSPYAERRDFANKALPATVAAILRDIGELEALGKQIREAMGEKPAVPVLTPEASEALSYIITTATEGGDYTREDFRTWRDYKHGDEGGGRFYAEVTVIPNDDEPGVPCTPVRLTPEELGRRLRLALDSADTMAEHRLMIARLLEGDEDVAGEMDVIDSGAMFQLAVYGKVIYG
jgi:hypothetical protein